MKSLVTFKHAVGVWMDGRPVALFNAVVEGGGNLPKDRIGMFGGSIEFTAVASGDGKEFTKPIKFTVSFDNVSSICEEQP